jgi:RNA polymerase sigma factor (sigma-70 family)
VQTGRTGHLIRLIRRVADDAALEPPTDRELLERSLGRGDDAAFGTLLRRHGSMVWALCRRVLGDCPDAEDAFQATFLVLVRKGASLDRPELLGNWLYGVAWRTARKARAASARRRAREKPLEDVAAPSTDVPWRELLPALDEEVSRLPDKYRAPIVLCYFRGKTYAEAARTLGLAEGTIASRLARARERLRRRLSRRGSAVSGGLVTAALSHGAAPAPPPSAVVSATSLAARSLAPGAALGGAISANVISLTEGVLQSMFIANLKIMAGAALALGILGTGTGVWWQRAMNQPGADETLVEARNGQAPGDAPAQRPAIADPKSGEVPQPAKGERKPAGEKKGADASSAAPVTNSLLRHWLDQPDVQEFDNNIPLKDALSSLSQTFGIPIVVDSEAFRNDAGINDILNQSVTFSRVLGVKRRMELRLLLGQVQGDFQLRDGVLFILPKVELAPGRVLWQPVDASFHQIPLNVALQKLSEQAGVSVVLDIRTAEKGQVAVTADLHNAPLQDAVRILSDMAGLRSVALENILYVTTRENSAKMEADKASHPAPLQTPTAPSPKAGVQS